MPSMRITKLGHACVRIEYDDTTIVLDPGSFTEPDAVDAVDAVLITHEHPDHYLADHLRRTDAPVFAVEAVGRLIRDEAPDVAERLTVVEPGSSFKAAGIAVRGVGELHAEIHPELARISNCGYVLRLGDATVYHPGDALTLPGEAVDVLLAPVCAPWMRVADGVEFARAVGAARNLAIHDRVFSGLGLGVADSLFGRFLGEDGLDYVRRADGEDL